MEIDDKGGEIVQRYESFGRDWDKDITIGVLDMDNRQRGSNIEEKDGSQFLDKKSTQVGGTSSWTLISCIWNVHSHVLACIA